MGSRIAWWRNGRKWEVWRRKISLWETKEYYYASTDDKDSQGPTFVYLVRNVRLKSQSALGTGAKREAGVLSEGLRGQSKWPEA